MSFIAEVAQVVAVINEIKEVKVALGYPADTPLIKIVQDVRDALKGLDVDKAE